MTEYVRNHRRFGKVATRVTLPDTGMEYTLIETAPGTFDAALSYTLLPVGPEELEFDARMAVVAAIEHCQFLGLSPDRLVAICQQEIALLYAAQSAPDALAVSDTP